MRISDWSSDVCSSDLLLPLPAGLTLEQSMAIGTAGYTAMLCLLALERHGVGPESGEVLATGPPGGGGSVAVAHPGRLGYAVRAEPGQGAGGAEGRWGGTGWCRVLI